MNTSIFPDVMRDLEFPWVAAVVQDAANSALPILSDALSVLLVTTIVDDGKAGRVNWYSVSDPTELSPGGSELLRGRGTVRRPRGLLWAVVDAECGEPLPAGIERRQGYYIATVRDLEVDQRQVLEEVTSRSPTSVLYVPVCVAIPHRRTSLVERRLAGILSVDSWASKAFAREEVCRFFLALGNLIGTVMTMLRLVYYDPLTGEAGVLSRRFVDDTIPRLKAAGEPGVLCAYLDINRFKDVNDRLNHDAGDDLLCEIGRRLREHVALEVMKEGGQCWVCRRGGDEFVVLASGLDKVTFERIVREALEGTTMRTGAPRAVVVSASVGVAGITWDASAQQKGMSDDKVVSEADKCQGVAKAIWRVLASLNPEQGGIVISESCDQDIVRTHLEAKHAQATWEKAARTWSREKDGSGGEADP